MRNDCALDLTRRRAPAALRTQLQRTQRNCLPGSDLQRELCQGVDIRTSRVGESHVRKLNVTLDCRWDEATVRQWIDRILGEGFNVTSYGRICAVGVRLWDLGFILLNVPPLVGIVIDRSIDCD